jgi:hypothetical protein
MAVSKSAAVFTEIAPSPATAPGHRHKFLPRSGNGISGLLHLRADISKLCQSALCRLRLFLQAFQFRFGFCDLTLKGIVLILPQFTVFKLLLCLYLRRFQAFQFLLCSTYRLLQQFLLLRKQCGVS